MTRFLDDVKTGVDAIDDFPEQTEPAVVEELNRTDAVISVAVTGPQDPVALKAYAEDLKDRMMAGDRGGRSRMWPDFPIITSVSRFRPGACACTVCRPPISPTRWVGQSVSSPAGRLEGRDEDLLLRFDDQRKTAESFHDLVVISGSTGAAIRLGEIAEIIDRFDRDEEKILFNGKRAALLNITKTRSQDILNILASVTEFIEAETTRAPQGIQPAPDPGPGLDRAGPSRHAAA